MYRSVSVVIVCTPPPFLLGRGVEPPTKFPKGEGEGLDRPSTLRGGLLQKREEGEGGGIAISQKKQLKSEFNDKKSL